MKGKKLVLPKWFLEEQSDKLFKMERQIGELQRRQKQTLTIYSADNESCIGMSASNWHRIVCKYEGSRCLGGPRPHWTSWWSMDEKGFHFESMLNEQWKGWHGQYHERNELKYDELPRDVLMLHSNTLKKHFEPISLWFPCHIYNDFTGDLYRP
jgi:hypothetical protein